MCTGAVIVAAPPPKAADDITAPTGADGVGGIQRMIAAFQKAGVSIVVVVTGGESRKLEKALVQRGVLFLHGKGQVKPFDCAKRGLDYLRDRCGRVFLTTAGTPLFLPSTLERMLEESGDIIVPTFEKQAGYPVLLTGLAIDELLADSGKDSIRAAISRCRLPKTRLAVADEGVLLPADSARTHPQREAQSMQLTRPILDISISTEIPLLDGRLMALLRLIDESRSVRTACELTQISYSTAWNTLNAVEDVLGYPLATRNKGGPSGSGTSLTCQGKALMEAYERMETDLRQQAQTLYDEYFRGIL